MYSILGDELGAGRTRSFRDGLYDILTSFKGIGKWTAELVMAASIGFNIIPTDDLGVRKAVSHFYFNDKLQSSSIVRSFIERKFGIFKRDIIVYLLMAYRLGL